MTKLLLNTGVSLVVPYNGLFSLGANFPEQCTINFSRNFPDLEFTNPTIEISHMSDISHTFYIVKLIICRTCVMSTVIMVFHSCMVTTCSCTGTSMICPQYLFSENIPYSSKFLWNNSFVNFGNALCITKIFSFSLFHYPTRDLHGACRVGSHYLHKLNDLNTEKHPSQLESHITYGLGTCHRSHTLTRMEFFSAFYHT